MQIVTFRQNIHKFRKTSPMPSLYICPKKYVLPAQPTNKRLSSSRNSITLPPPSLSITDFITLHRSTHAIASIRWHKFSRVLSFRIANHEVPILAGTYLFILARLDRWLAGVWRDAACMPKFGIEMLGPVRHFARLAGLSSVNRTENSPYFELC